MKIFITLGVFALALGWPGGLLAADPTSTLPPVTSPFDVNATIPGEGYQGYAGPYGGEKILQYCYFNRELGEPKAGKSMYFEFKACHPDNQPMTGEITWGDGTRQKIERVTCGRWRIPHTYYSAGDYSANIVIEGETCQAKTASTCEPRGVHDCEMGPPSLGDFRCTPDKSWCVHFNISCLTEEEIGQERCTYRTNKGILNNVTCDPTSDEQFKTFFSALPLDSDLTLEVEMTTASGQKSSVTCKNLFSQGGQSPSNLSLVVLTNAEKNFPDSGLPMTASVGGIVQNLMSDLPLPIAVVALTFSVGLLLILVRLVK